MLKEKSEKNKLKKGLKLILPIIAVAIIVAIIIGLIFNNLQIRKNDIDPELARAMEYDPVNPGEETTQSEFVEFDAFFLRDLNGDNRAEGVRGTCTEIGKEDTLYMQLKVLREGYLENAKITVNGDKNYYLQTAIVEDNEVKQNYIGEDTQEIEFKTINSGFQKLLTASVRSGDYRYESSIAQAIGYDTKNYSKENFITFTGTHVQPIEGGEAKRTPIEKTIRFNVDWYGTVEASIDNTRQTRNLQTTIDEENQELNLEFTVGLVETKGQLNLKKMFLKGVLPELSGYAPTNVEISGKNVQTNYNSETRYFTIQREAILDENEVINTVVNDSSNYIGKYNEYKIKVTYPLEAYKAIGADTVELRIPVEGYFEGYNNKNKQFKNPYISNKANSTIIVTYKNPEGTVALFAVRVGKYTSYQSMNIVSKQKPLRIYNGVSEWETDDNYKVTWIGQTGTDGKFSGLTMKETENGKPQVSDKFITTSSVEESMEEITSNVAIYFSGSESTLGSEGWIRVYDDETNQLLQTFTKDNWNIYDEKNPYWYEYPIKHIRVETSATNENSSLIVSNIKQLNDDIIVGNYTKDEFDELQYIESTLTGYFGDEKTNTDIGKAIYEAPVSVSGIYIDRNYLSTQITEKNVPINISTIKRDDTEVGWINGSFLIEFPKSVIDININDVLISDDQVKILSYEEYDEDGKKFIKINTENEEETVYNITVYCDITADPAILTQTMEVKLYASNEHSQYYYRPTPDIYDVNSNSNKIENVHIHTCNVKLMSPTSLLTSQIAQKYDLQGSKAIAPQVAIIAKNQKTAEVVMDVTNNYSDTIKEIKLIGKIPFNGNTYVINKGNLNSEFNTTMSDKGIILPSTLQGRVKVYYSTVEDPNTEDIKNASNQWDESPESFDNIKSFLIDFENTTLGVGEKYQISYEIKIPDNLQYNQVSYSHHAVYFSLQTKSGLFETNVEPNKLGFMIGKQYDLKLTKYHKGQNKLVQGAIYSVQEEGGKTRTKVTDEAGNLTIENLFVEKNYIIKEVKTPYEYELNEEEIKFTTTEEDNKIQIQVLSGNPRDTRVIEEDNSIQIDVEDKVRANLKIIKKEKNNRLANVRYKITGKGLLSKGQIIETDRNGEIDLKGLCIDEIYTIEEIKADGYYLASPIKFKLTQNETNYVLDIIDSTEEIEQTIIRKEVKVNDQIPTIEFELQNEAIPTYNLKINKIKEEEETPMASVKFGLYKDGVRLKSYVTNEEGIIEISGLYKYVEEKKVEQKYTLKEESAPEGYAKVDDITFYASDKDGELNLTIEGGKVADTQTNEDTITITIEDVPLFKLRKIDGKTQEILPGVKFAIYNYLTNEPAVGEDGKIVGEKEEINGKQYYVVTTNEKGEIVEALPEGLYKAVELETFDEYELATERYFGIGMSQDGVVDYDLVDAQFLGEIGFGESIESVTATYDGGYIVGGFFNNNASGGTLEIDGKEFNNTGYDGTNDGIIIKYTSDGKVEWISHINGQDNDIIWNVTQTLNGKYIAVGYTNSEKVVLSDEIKLMGTSYWCPMIIQYDEQGKVEWATTYMGDAQLKEVTATNDGGYIIAGYFLSNTIKIANKELTNKGYYDGIVIKYSSKNEIEWVTQIGGVGPDEIESVSQTKDGGYLCGGTLGSNIIEFEGVDPLISAGSNDGMIINLDEYGNVKWARTVGEGGCHGVTKVIETNDGGYVAGGYYNNSTPIKAPLMKFDSEGIMQWKTDLMLFDGVSSIIITKDEGYIVAPQGSGIFIKCSKDGKIEWNDLGSGEKYTRRGPKFWRTPFIYDMAKISDDEYIAVGYTLGDLYIAYGDKIENKYTNALSIVKYKEVEYEPAIPETKEIEVKNNIKQLQITTEVKVEENEEKGGEISGENIKPYETVEYGKNSESIIEMTPYEGYEIYKIEINGEEIDFDVNEEGKYVLPQFTNMKEDKHVVVTYIQTSQKPPEVIVHHYKKGTNIRVAKDERYTGKLNETYTTKPQTDLEDYELIKDSEGNYIVPKNASGTFKQTTEEVIYEYEQRKILLTVHHYIEGTETRVPMPDGRLAEDVKQEGELGANYSTEAIIPDSKFELVGEPENKTGIYEKPEVVVNYYYRGTIAPGVVVHHIDIDTGKNIVEDETIPKGKSARYGDPYVTSMSKEVLDRYEFVSKTDNWTGTITESEIEVTYKYRIKYNMQITKQKGNTTEAIKGVKFNIKGEGLEDKGKEYITDEKGNINIENLVSGVTYTLQETYAPQSYIINEEPIIFKVVRTAEGKMEMQVESGVTKHIEIDEIQEGVMPQVHVIIGNATKYDLKLVKYRKDSTQVIEGVTFNIKGEGLLSEGKNYTTDSNGVIKISNLIPGKQYTIQEVESNINYKINNQIIKFETHVEDEGTLQANIVDGDVRQINVEQAQEKTIPQVEIQIENEPNYNIEITKYEKGTDNKITGATFLITGKNYEDGETITTDENGIATINGLEVSELYTIKETSAEGYIVNEEEFTVRLTKVENQLQIEYNGREAKQQPTLREEENENPVVQISMENEKLLRYNLIINKVTKDSNMPLEGAKFALYINDKYIKNYTTESNGNIVINDLYQYNQKCVLKEIYAPTGYAKVDDITFYVKRQEGELSIDVTEGTVKEKSIEGDNITITIEDGPSFKLTKKELGTDTLLPGVKFAIFNDEDGQPARDIKGDIIGEREIINGETYYIVTTDEKGEISANLENGTYKLVEIEALEQYDLGENTDRVHYFSINPPKYTKKEYVVSEGVSISGNKDEVITGAIETEDGGYILIGYFSSDSITLTDGSTMDKSGASTNSFIIKYDADGQIQWKKQWNSEIINAVDQIKTQNDEYEYILVGSNNQESNTSGKLMKYDKDGNQTWSKDIPAIFTTVTATEDGGFITGGYYTRDFYLDGQYYLSEDIDGSHSSNQSAGLIVKYKKDGEIEWKDTIIGTPVLCHNDDYYDDVYYRGAYSDTRIIKIIQNSENEYTAIGSSSAYVLNFSDGTSEDSSYIPQNFEDEGNYAGISIKYKNGKPISFDDYGSENEEGFNDFARDIIKTSDGGHAILTDEAEYYGGNIYLYKYNANNILDNSIYITSCNNGEHYSNHCSYIEEFDNIYQDKNGGYIYGGEGKLKKYDDTFMLEWEFNNIGSIRDIIQLKDGSYLAVGAFTENITVHNGEELTNTSATTSNSDAMIIKIEPIDVEITDEGVDVIDIYGKSIGGDSNDGINSMLATADGGYIVGGYFAGSQVVLDENHTLLNSKSGYSDGMIIKYNKNNEVEWATKVGGDRNDQIVSITATSDGGYVAGGYFNSKIINIDDRTLLNSDQGSSPGYDGMLIKYDKNYRVEWVTSVGGNGDDQIVSVSETSDGGYIVGGYFASDTIEIESRILRRAGNSKSYTDGMLIKYNKNNQVEWVTSIGGDRDEQIKSVSATNDGGYIVGGYFSSNTITIEDKILTKSGTSGTSYTDGMIIKYNKNNQVEWATSVGGNNYDYINCVSATSDGGYIVGGDFTSSELTIGNNTLTKVGSDDGVLIKYNANNEVEWIEGYKNAQLLSVAQTNDKGYIASGYYNNAGSFIKIDALGVQEWEKQIEGVQKNIVRAVAQLEDGYYLLAGEFNSPKIKLSNGEDLENAGSNTSDAMIIGFKHQRRAKNEKEIELFNKVKEFKITTEVEMVNGEKGGHILGEDSTLQEPYETVKYGKNSSLPITMTPNEGYEIVKITINGVEQDFPEQSGTYTLPQLTNITEDKHIKVTYMLTSNKLTIVKQDEKDNTLLAGAKFKIDQIETREQPTNVIGGIVNNGQEYKVADKTQDITSNVMKEMIKNGNDYEVTDIENPLEEKLGAKVDDSRYYFTEGDNGILESNNKGDSNSTAHSYYEINLEDYSGEDLVVVIEAEVSSEERYDIGYATITKSSYMPMYNESSGQFMKISGKIESTSYTSQVLTKGIKNYLHLGYYKDGGGNDGEDKLTIYSIKVCGLTTGRYYFEGSGTGPYVSNNTGKAGTQANSCIPIDLTSYQGKYHLIINAKISCEYEDYYDYEYDYGYIVIKDDSTMPSDSWDGTRVTYELCGEQSNEYDVVLDGEKEYFLNFVYYKDEDDLSNYGDDKFTINSINIYKEVTKSFGFEGTEAYTSNNVGEPSTTANAYIPINLTGLSGTYEVTVNAEISSSGYYDYGYAVITTTDDRPSYNSGTRVIERIYGKKEMQDYTAVINGGSEYFLHFAYVKDSSEDSGDITDTFKINSVQVSLSDEGLYHGEVTTDKNGKAVAQVPIGKYEITEIEPPEGYMICEEKTYQMQEGIDNTVTFSDKKYENKVIVHHYLKEEEAEQPQERQTVAEDEEYTGAVGASYKTNAHYDLEDYELLKNEDGEYILPQNAEGNFKEGEEVVIYEYERRKLPLVVHHYIQGTNQNVPLQEGEAKDVTDMQIKGTSYETNPVTPREDYELVKMPDNWQGTYQYPGVEVTYEYRLKRYEITTRVELHTEIIGGKEEQVAGGVILGEGETPYETVEYKGNSTKPIIITPDPKYRVKSIKVNENELPESEYTKNEDGTITLNQFTNVQQNKEVVVEFEKIPAKVLVYHYVEYTKDPIDPENPYDIIEGQIGTQYQAHAREDTGDYVLAEDNLPKNESGMITKDGMEVIYYYRLRDTQVIVHHYKDGTNVDEIPAQQVALDEIINGKVNDDYETVAKEDIENYEVATDKIPYNATGKMSKDTTEVTYYYRLKQAEIINNSLSKEGPEKITNENEKFAYTIRYNAEIGEYTGTAKIKIIDKLPYEIDQSKSNLMGGTYNPVDRTITWEITIQNIDVYGDMSKSIEEIIEIELVFVNIDHSKKSLVNKVSGTLTLEESEQEVEIPEVIEETEIDFKTSMVVTKYWNHGNNEYTMPTKVKLQVKNKENIVKEEIVTIDNQVAWSSSIWEYVFEDLDKYDEEGNEIEYTIDEQPVGEGELDFYKKQIDNENKTITNTYIGPVIRINKTAVTENELDYVTTGERITYTLTIKNEGEMAQEVVVKDTIPEGTEFVGGSIKIGEIPIEEATEGVMQNTEEQLNQGIKINMEPKTSKNITFEVIVKDSENGTYIKNEAKINKSPNDPQSKDEASNKVIQKYLKEKVNGTKYAITESGANYALEGEKIRYEIVVVNEGRTAKEVKVKDTIPEGTTFVDKSIKIDGQTTYNDEDLTLKTQNDLSEGITVRVEGTDETKDTPNSVKLSFEVTVDEGILDADTYKKEIKNTALVDDVQTPEVVVEVIKPKVESAVEKQGTEKVTDKAQEINYQIKYTAQVENYDGNAQVTIVDELPYELDEEKMKEMYDKQNTQQEENEDWLKTYLQGGQYDRDAKTIIWIENIQGLQVLNPREIVVNKNITVIFKNVNTKLEKITNTVRGKIELENKEQTSYETEPNTFETQADYKKNIKVTKTWDHGNSIYEKPSKVKIIIRNAKEKDQIVQEYTIGEDENWTHIFMGLSKYDDDGNEIEYLVEEEAIAGESIDYYKMTVE